MSRFSNTAWLVVLVLAAGACASQEDAPRGQGGGANDASGGAVSSSGGAPSQGGAAVGNAGGSISNGGSTSGGAMSSSGGKSPNGGQPSGNGGRATAAGGSTSGGASATSGGSLSANGGASVGGSSDACGRAVGACTAPVVRITDVTLPSAAVGYGQEGDTDPLPYAIASTPAGGSRIAWLSSDKKNVYVGELDCDDKLVGTPFSFPGLDLQDLYADAAGGVVLLTRDATGSGTDHCGSGMLCGGTSSPCRDMYMVRFDTNGSVVWETKVTNLSATLDGYQNGARFVWWYQHHGRLAFDGSNYAAYFGTAITVNNNACVDIHEGDRMQVVSSTGAPVSGHDSFDFGCSHAWTSRIVWDPRTKHFVMVCATDNNCRIARPNPYRTIATGTCDNTLFGGDLVLSTTAGYWTAWSQGGTVRLQHFTDTGPDTAVDSAGSSQHPHLVPYANDKMLLAFASGTSMTAQVRDAGANADAIGSPFSIAANDHNYMAFKAYPDGSVAYPASGGSSTALKIARVMPCQ